MTVQPLQGYEPGDTPPDELDPLIGVAAAAARELVGSRPSDPGGLAGARSRRSRLARVSGLEGVMLIAHLAIRQLGDPGLH
jgi:hypothetical protein